MIGICAGIDQSHSNPLALWAGDLSGIIYDRRPRIRAARAGSREHGELLIGVHPSDAVGLGDLFQVVRGDGHCAPGQDFEPLLQRGADAGKVPFKVVLMKHNDLQVFGFLLLQAVFYSIAIEIPGIADGDLLGLVLRRIAELVYGDDCHIVGSSRHIGAAIAGESAISV